MGQEPKYTEVKRILRQRIRAEYPAGAKIPSTIELHKALRVSPGTIDRAIRELVDEYFYKYHYKMFPVSGDSVLEGCINSRQVKEIPREQWDQRRVQDVLAPCSVETTVAPDTDAMKALSIMNRTGNSRLMVVDGDRLVGIITLKDMLKFLDLKMDLEGE